MSILDKQTRGDLVKLIIFIVVTTLATGVLVVLIGNLSFESKRPYKAVFSDATGVVKGDDVRIAGVKVGSVKEIKIVDRTRALVSFTVADSSVLTKSSTATIRYRNLVGQRYISLTQGVGDLSRMPEDATIPMSRTAPALDLSVLFNGFKPLFAALSPADINKLSAELIQVFQGEGGNLNELLTEHGLAHQHPRRPRSGDRVADRQPQRRARHARRSRQAAQRPDRGVQELHGRSRAGQGRDPRIARLRLRAGQRRPPTSRSGSVPRSSRT